MDAHYTVAQDTIAEKFSNIYNAGRIPVAELQRFKLMLAHTQLSQEEISLLDRILHAVKRGWLEVID